MIRYLTSISLALLLCQLLCASPLSVADTISAAAAEEASSLPDEEVVRSVDSREFGMLMTVRGREMTGLCIMELSPDGSLVGTVVNEFGVKAFDFTFDSKKAKVLNLIKPLDRWYIRKVLRADLAFMIPHLLAKTSAAKGCRTVTAAEDGSVKVSNDRYKIYYTFTPMTNEP